MGGRLWLGLAWLLLARPPGAAGTPGSPRRPRSYPHLEGDVRWRRLFSSTHFFLRVDPSGRVQGTRWRHGADSESGEGVRGRQAGRKAAAVGTSRVLCYSLAGASVSSSVKWASARAGRVGQLRLGSQRKLPALGLARTGERSLQNS